MLQAEELRGSAAKQIVNILFRQTLSGAEHLHRIRESPIGMGKVTADHQPVGAEAFRDVRQCGIVRAEREIKIAEAFSGSAPRLLSRGSASVVGGFESIHQPRNETNADFEETPTQRRKAIDHPAKDQLLMGAGRWIVRGGEIQVCPTQVGRATSRQRARMPSNISLGMGPAATAAPFSANLAALVVPTIAV